MEEFRILYTPNESGYGRYTLIGGSVPGDAYVTDDPITVVREIARWLKERRSYEHQDAHRPGTDRLPCRPVSVPDPGGRGGRTRAHSAEPPKEVA